MKSMENAHAGDGGRGVMPFYSGRTSSRNAAAKGVTSRELHGASSWKRDPARHLTFEQIRRLQQNAGNRAVQHWLRRSSVRRFLRKSVMAAEDRVTILQRYKADTEPEMAHLLRQTAGLRSTFAKFVARMDTLFGKPDAPDDTELRRRDAETDHQAGQILQHAAGVEARCEQVSKDIGTLWRKHAVSSVAVPMATPLPGFQEAGIAGGHQEEELKRFLTCHPEYHVVEIRKKIAQGTMLRLYKQYMWKKDGRPPAPANLSERPAANNPTPDGWVTAEVRLSTAENLARWLDRGKDAANEWDAFQPGCFRSFRRWKGFSTY
ncbi:hypothetical protein [Paenibacillus elgii]|uniref:hypothetical protein n=1 Tax=Paenibacillus elgii TaxID=189691 RepID=UPI002040FDDB|nr:hypothetical protein [Paenibacillus elgii]MCM3272314.1 hypothetical protein [Paenibacillus elgii]